MCVVGLAVAMAALTGVALASVAPGQRLADYVYAHSSATDKPEFRGVVLLGGHTVVVNGSAQVRGVTAVVLTRLPRTRAATLVAQRLCLTAVAGTNKLGLAIVGRVVVTDRGDDGTNPNYPVLVDTEQATDAVTHLPLRGRIVCHRWSP